MTQIQTHIDKTFFINLNRRIDRRLLIENILTEYGLDWERFAAIEIPTFGLLGCVISHMMVLQIAKERNYKNVLILEDDFTFILSKENFYKELNHFFSLNMKFDVCMLAYNMIQSFSLNNPIVDKVIEAQTASGYIVNCHYFDKLIDIYRHTIPLLYTTKQHWNYANDQIWKSLQLKDNWVFFKNRIGKQRASYSDNSEQYCDYNC